MPRKGNMEPAIIAAFDDNIPFARSISMIAEAGFEIVALPKELVHSEWNTKKGRAEVERLIEENGMKIDSLHAPYEWEIDCLCEAKRQEEVRKIKMAVDFASELGIKIVVIHSGYGDSEKEAMKKSIDSAMKSMAVISEYALRRGVMIAVENLPGRSRELVEFILREFSEDPIGLCYDTGHENQVGECFGILELLGHRLLTTHIHDNLGRADLHALPYEGNIDWPGFVNALGQAGYSGNLLLESTMNNSQFKDPVMFLREAKARAVKLVKLVTPGFKRGGMIC